MAMPRPTVAQLAYGSCTVVFSTFAMLLVSRTGSAVGIALVAVVALGLGLLVAMTVPPSGSRPAAARQPAPPEPVRATVPSAAHEPVRERAAS
ncbi:hypothetical protein [Streptomyces griseomycini]|uniref:hypothetical protein n=1 Tax=Streptomyces griseomycini TaxID=66895 RepID=UPI0016170A85|nr:hypothetical protein [Streptomyces griseomycini]GGP88555.1 hypothetical protein GCM10010266_09820 [Streptomyces griseomycini]GGR17159.1 hypothetical protein GCM10015536_23430 [Streptomyces griseomycini]